MEYANGGELFSYIVSKKRLCSEEASFFFVQIINGLEYIHKNNVVHRFDINN
jgi:serine/threonine-protein kinase HSL1 (negative regulator of Swe1 kinase)